jgi:hypothetical protein
MGIKICQLSRHLALEVLWWNPKLPASKSNIAFTLDSQRRLPLAVMRSKWMIHRLLYCREGGTQLTDKWILEALFWNQTASVGLDMGGEKL